MSTLLHELGHTMQWLKMMPGSREGKDFYDRLSMDKRQIKSKYSPYGSVYSDPHTLEYQADRPLKRMLWDYVFHGDKKSLEKIKNLDYEYPLGYGYKFKKHSHYHDSSNELKESRNKRKIRWQTTE